MSQDIRGILARMDIIESGLTPVGVRRGLNPQQRQAHQLPAEKRARTIRALGAETDPQHPFQGYAVGSSESQERPGGLAEAMADIEEDMLGKIKNDLSAYLDQLADKVSDDGQRDRSTTPRDQIATKPQDRELVPRQSRAAPVHSLAMEDGRMLEVHGDDDQGYEIRCGEKSLPTRFPQLPQAQAAMRFWHAQRPQHMPKTETPDTETTGDYIEER